MSDEAKLQEWVSHLRGYDGRARQRAARALQDYGPAAVEPLCAALHDRDEDVRVAAAESLGAIGDDRAVQPLTAALRASLGGGSARWQLVLGILAVVGCVTAGSFFFFGVIALKMSVPFWVFFWGAGRPVKWFAERRRARGRLCQAITSALARIAERCPTPALRTVVPELRAIASDAVHHERRTREVSLRAAEQIESLTGKLQSLPVSAEAPGEAVAALPTPAEAPAGDSRKLPRV